MLLMYCQVRNGSVIEAGAVLAIDQRRSAVVIPVPWSPPITWPFGAGFHNSTGLEAWRPMLEDIAGTKPWEWVVHSR